MSPNTFGATVCIKVKSQYPANSSTRFDHHKNGYIAGVSKTRQFTSSDYPCNECILKDIRNQSGNQIAIKQPACIIFTHILMWVQCAHLPQRPGSRPPFLCEVHRRPLHRFAGRFCWLGLFGRCKVLDICISAMSLVFAEASKQRKRSHMKTAKIKISHRHTHILQGQKFARYI